MRILLVDDDASVRQTLRGALSRMGHEVAEAPDGMKAWLLFRKAPSQAVVSDWSMPEMDGMALVRRVREDRHGPLVHFILITGANTSEADYKRALAEGVDDFLPKPVDLDLLWVRLRLAERVLALDERLGLVERLLASCRRCGRARLAGGADAELKAYAQAHPRSGVSREPCPSCSPARS